MKDDLTELEAASDDLIGAMQQHASHFEWVIALRRFHQLVTPARVLELVTELRALRDRATKP